MSKKSVLQNIGHDDWFDLLWDICQDELEAPFAIIANKLAPKDAEIVGAKLRSAVNRFCNTVFQDKKKSKRVMDSPVYVYDLEHTFLEELNFMDCAKKYGITTNNLYCRLKDGKAWLGRKKSLSDLTNKFIFKKQRT